MPLIESGASESGRSQAKLAVAEIETKVHSRAEASIYQDSVTLNRHRAFSPANQKFYRDEDLFVDLLTQVGMLDSEILALTRMEYRLLAVLVKHADEVVPQPILLMFTPLVDVHLWRLRKNLGKCASQYIGTVTETGYRFRPFQPRG